MGYQDKAGKKLGVGQTERIERGKSSQNREMLGGKGAAGRGNVEIVEICLVKTNIENTSTNKGFMLG